MCDTFALSEKNFRMRKNFFLKVSDRLLGEAQPLRFFPAEKHVQGEKIQTSSIVLDQVESTYGFLGCHSQWGWGVGMGINECGLAVGNNAEGSRTDPEPETNVGLVGADLVRLALERAATAREALDVITTMIETYGQNASTSVIRPIIVDATFMLVDPKEIWLLETAGRRWVARQIKDFANFSNAYTIEDEFDLCSHDLEEYAREKRWLRSDEKFNFSNTYQVPGESALARYRKVHDFIANAEAPLDINDMLRILRDHQEGEIIEPRFGDFYGSFQHVCMHAQTANDSQTVATLMAWVDEDFGPVVRYVPSVSCCSIAFPAYLKAKIPAAMACAENVYNPESLFWTVERLAWAISIDGKRFGDKRAEIRELETEILEKTEITEQQARILVRAGKEDEAFDLLGKLVEESTAKAMELMDRLYYEIREAVNAEGGLYGLRTEVISTYCARVKMPLCDSMEEEQTGDGEVFEKKMNLIQHH